MTGPLTGLKLPGATNVTLAMKITIQASPWAVPHHGWFGRRMKAAGLDGIIVTGKSDKPVYLWIDNGKAELRDAGHLWGKKDSHETEGVIQSEIGNSKASVAAIGPAGENLVVGGMICNDKNHSFSHSGGGSVMGSKKLKAIAIYGDQHIPVADADKVKFMMQDWLTQMKRPGHFGYSVLRGSKLKKGDYRHRAATTGFVGKNFLENELRDFGLGLQTGTSTDRVQDVSGVL
jgi:aldehyde:ferredoxin oxidoreductase